MIITKQQMSLKNRLPLKLMFITNRPDVAKIAEKNMVDRIWIDLETRGKKERQGHVDSVKSYHKIADVSKIRNTISKAQLLVRVNPLWEGSRSEINEVVSRGVDIIMLPMFRTADDAKQFVDLVNGRAKVLLLVETIDAEKNIDEIASVAGIDEIHIGLNDLHLAYGMKFMFELLANGQVEALTQTINSHGLPYGFGGIARLNEGMLPARHVIDEHYRLGSSMAILSRSFFDSWIEHDIEEIERVFKFGMKEIREYEKQLITKSPEFFTQKQETVKHEVAQIVEIINKKHIACATVKSQ